MSAATFEVISGDPTCGVVIHVPHASTQIPAGVRGGIVLDDEALAAEAQRMADVATDMLATEAAARSGQRPWMLVNRVSRLVVDPERFPDEREPMNAHGMGAIYHSTSGGEVLRRPDEERDEELIDRYFRPYASAMEQLVAARLAACDHCTILDLHSYPRDPLPYERSDAERPEVCLGTDAFHTPRWLVEAVQPPFLPVGGVQLDTPFSGTYVPLRFYQRERRVASVMLELRRDVYGWGDRSTQPWTAVVEALGQAIQNVCLSDRAT